MADTFKIFADEINNHFINMQKNTDRLYRVNIDGDDLWEAYLNSFPKGTNNIFKERAEHDCSACRSFIKQYGNVVYIDDNYNTISIWDAPVSEYPYTVVSKSLSKIIHNAVIISLFLGYEKKIGVKENKEQLEDNSIITWHHFYSTLDKKFVQTNSIDRNKKIGSTKDDASVLYASLTNITIEAAQIVLELIEQNSLYRGKEFKYQIMEFIRLKKEFDKTSNQINFCWFHAKPSYRFKNSVIGTLLIDISDNRDLEIAVSAYETKVAPHNYKRPTALVTKKMIDNAKEEIMRLGIMDSLYRRHATINDLTINNIIFADRQHNRLNKDIFDELKSNIPETKRKNYKNIEEIHISDFIDKIIPKIDSCEIMVDNTHLNNMVSIIAPENKDAPNIFKWNNNFSWSYISDTTDSIKTRVEKAGGKTDGILRCSLAWYNIDDLDIHVIEPNENEIYYKHPSSDTSGVLDVDMNASRHTAKTNPVENITWNNEKKMLSGKYKLIVNNFCKRTKNNCGCELEIACGDQLFKFKYNKDIQHNDSKIIAEFEYNKETKSIKILSSIEANAIDIWNIKTGIFYPVSLIMYSPNHWENSMNVGNKHYIFIIDNCKNPNETRGFYNEFLKPEYNSHRKVFELLANKIKVQYSDDQLSGIGFSETMKNSIMVKVSGSFNRQLKIMF